MAQLRVVELYCGIGGLAAAVGDLESGWARVVAAVDINQAAIDVCRHNFEHPTMVKLADTLDRGWLRSLEADLWWASPPCQPFTRRGRRLGLEDPRARTFLALLEHIEAVRPRFFAFENVVGFQDSDAHARLHQVLAAAGYGHVLERLLCPSEFGVPNRRPRYYLVAGRSPLVELAMPIRRMRALADFLDRDAEESLWVSRDLVESYRHALHIVDRVDPQAISTCFTSAYGRSPVRSGSYLREPIPEGPRIQGKIRRFSPAEVLRLLSFPPSFQLPADLDRRMAWRLVGNSLSLEPVRHMLSAIPRP